MNEVLKFLCTIAEKQPSIQVILFNYQNLKSDEKVGDLCKKLDERMSELEELVKENPNEAETMTIPDEILADIQVQFQEYLEEWGKKRKKRVYMCGVTLYCCDGIKLDEDTQNLIDNILRFSQLFVDWDDEEEQEYQDTIDDFTEKYTTESTCLISPTSVVFYFGTGKSPCNESKLVEMIAALNKLIDRNEKTFDSYSIIYV